MPASPSSRDNGSAGTVGMIGLGIMGSAMAANLVRAGFAVSGCDPVPAARSRLRRAGGTPRADAAAVARTCERIVLSLPSVAALDQVCDAIAAHGRRGAIVAETSTLPVADKERARRRLAAAGIVLLDCPLSGTGAQARVRDLAVYASGPARAIRAFAPVFDGFARARYDVGGFGNGMRMKLVANLLVAIHNIAAAEAILFGERAGLDPAQVVQVVADGAGGSRMFQVRGPTMVARGWGEATMKVSTWQKDMGLIAAALAATDTPAPLFAACVPVYNAAMGQGHGGDDTAAVYAVLERLAGGGSAPSAGAAPPARRPRRAARR
ncbi:MAG: NAD(P)-dependent oxidoreductase [Burkholderiales bacterium]|nr:NAD(P)-dependent oxidoreductase [Burkholderiales bacterium]